MNKLFISAIAVAMVSTAVAQEKAVTVKGKVKAETRAEVSENAVKASQNTNADANTEVDPETLKAAAESRKEAAKAKAESKLDAALGKAAEAGEVAIGENVNAEHGIAVSTVAKSTDLIGSRGELVSNVAITKALEMSPNADRIKLGNVKAGIKANTGIKVKPVNVATKVRVKTGLGVKL